MKSVGGVGSPLLGVSSVAIMGFAVRHDLSYPELLAFVRLFRRLPHGPAELEAHRRERPEGLAAFGALA